MQQQLNLILLVAGLAAGPVAASFVVSATMLRRLRVGRRVPPYAFSGDPLELDYTLENSRRWSAALALFIEDELVPVDRSVSGSSAVPVAGLLQPGAGPGEGAGALAGGQPEAGAVRVPDAGGGHPVAVRPARTPGHGQPSPAG